MSINCRLPKEHFTREKITWSNDEGYLNDLDRRLKDFWDDVANNGPPTTKGRMDSIAKALFMARQSAVSNLAQVYRVNPGNISRGWSAFWARNFAMARKGFGISKHFTEIGAARSHLSSVAKKWAGAVSDAIAEVEAVHKVATAYEEIDSIRRSRKIPQWEWDELLADALEVGWQPFAKDYMGLTDRSAAFFGAAQDDLFRHMQEMGLSGAEVKAIVTASKDVADTYHEVLNIARRSGMQVGDVAPLGYMPRQFSQDMMKRLEFEYRGKVVVDDVGNEIRNYEAFQKARHNFNFVLEDEVLLDALLRSNDPNIYGKISQHSRTKISGIGDLIDSKYGVTDALLNYLSENQLNILVEQGLLSKVPMRTTEVYKKLKEAYKLPYEGLNELLAADWREGMRIYSERLQHMASDAGQTWALTRNAIEQKWGVTKADYFRNGGHTGKYSGWIPLAEAIPSSIRTRFGLQEAAVTGTAFDHFDDIYVPRTIADLYGSMLDLSTDPYKLGLLDHLVGLTRKSRSALQTMYIMSTGFGINQIIQNAVQTLSATGTAGRNGLRAINDFVVDVGKHFGIAMSHTHGKDYSDWLESTKKIYDIDGKKLTEKQLWKWSVRNGLIDHFVPGTTGMVRGQKYIPKSIDPKKAYRYLRNTFEQYGAIATGEKLLQSSEFVLSRGAAPFLWINMVAENAAKFSSLKSMTRGEAIPSQKAIEHIGRYFYDYGDKGELDPVIGTFLPFWGFVGKNMNGSLRQIKESPGLYANVLRLHAMATSPAPAGFPEDSQASWIADQSPVWFEDDGKYFYFPLDRYAAVFEGVKDVNDFWFENLGLFPSGSREQELDYNLDHAPWHEPNHIKDILNNSFGIYQAGASLIAGEDIRTGRPFSDLYSSEIFGIQVDPRTRYLLDTLLPPIGRINKFISNRLTPGAPVIAETPMGKIEISLGDGKSRIKVAKETQSPTWFEEMGSFLGIRGVDTLYASGLKREEIIRTYHEGTKFYKNLIKEFERTDDDQQRDRLLQKLVETRLGLAYFRHQFARFEQFRISKGMHTNRALREMRDKHRLKIWELPDLPESSKKALEAEIERDLDVRYR